MKNILTALTHMIFWASSVLLFRTLYDSSGQMVVYAIISAVLAAACFLMRMKITKMWVFIASHILAMVGGSYIVILSGVRIWHVFILVLIFGYSIILRCVQVAHDFDRPRNLYVGFAAAIYVLIWLLEGDSLAKGLGLTFVIMLFLLALLYDNLHSADWFMEVRNLSEDADAQRASRFSKRISFLYTGGIGVLLGLSAFISMDGVWNAIKSGVRRLLVYLVSLIPHGEFQPQEDATQVEGEFTLGMLENIVEETTEHSLLVKAFDAVAPVVTIIGVIVLVIIAVVAVAMAMYRGFYQKRVLEDEKLLVEKLKVDKKLEREKRKRFAEKSESNLAKRIRRIYKRSMHKLGVKALQNFPYMTPEEQVEKHTSIHEEKDVASEICDIYEKARYGKGMVTDTDVERMKSLM